METFRDRLAWIIEHRRMPDTGDAWDAKALSLAAELGEAHVGMILRKTIGEPRRPTVEKIARAARVSFLWLLTGQGSPDDVEGQAVERDAPAPVYSESDRPRFNTLPHWAELLARAKAMRPTMETWVWDAIAVARPMLTAEPTPLMIAELADWTQRHESVIRPRAERKETGATPRATARAASAPPPSTVATEPPAPLPSENPLPFEETGPSGIRTIGAHDAAANSRVGKAK